MNIMQMKPNFRHVSALVVVKLNMKRNASPKNYQRLRPGRTVLSCSVDADVWHWLRTQADAAGLPVSQYLSKLVRSQIDAETLAETTTTPPLPPRAKITYTAPKPQALRSSRQGPDDH